MVNNAKQIAQNPHDQYAAQNWRGTNDHLLNSVRAVGDAITGVPMSNGRHSSYQESISRASPYNPVSFFVDILLGSLNYCDVQLFLRTF